MIEKINTIKNPLTIIGIFAALVEISGTAVLPFVSENNQLTYIYFLIIFPCFLVFSFFLTLNFNHKVLYAPSDYTNEDNFMKHFKRASSQESANKLRNEIEMHGMVSENFNLGEIAEASEKLNKLTNDLKRFGEASEDILKSTHKNEHTEKARNINLQTKYFLAEELIIRKLTEELGPMTQREVVYTMNNMRLMFDGVLFTDNRFSVIEVKYISSIVGILRALENANQLYNSLDEDRKSKFNFILALGTDVPESEYSDIRESVLKKAKSYKFNIDIRMYDITKLEKEYGLI